MAHYTETELRNMTHEELIAVIKEQWRPFPGYTMFIHPGEREMIRRLSPEYVASLPRYGKEAIRAMRALGFLGYNGYDVVRIIDRAKDFVDRGEVL